MKQGDGTIKYNDGTIYDVCLMSYQHEVIQAINIILKKNHLQIRKC